jgi:hypothetical protein
MFREFQISGCPSMVRPSTTARIMNGAGSARAGIASMAPAIARPIANRVLNCELFINDSDMLNRIDKFPRQV